MRILLALLLAAAPVSTAMAQGVTTTADRTSDFQIVIGMLQSGKAADAIDILDPILADYERSYADEKRTLYCAEDDSEAQLYEDAAKASGKTDYLVIDQGWCFALWAKGYALVDIHKIRDGLPFLERAVAMAPYRAQYLSELGNAYQELRQWDKALAVFTRAAESSERLMDSYRIRMLTRAWRGMGFNLIELGRWDEAEAMFRKCLEFNPNDDKAKNELTYIQQKRPRKAK